VEAQMESAEMQMWRDRSLVGKTVFCLGRLRMVTAIYVNIPGGVRLDCPVLGFISWNVDSLSLA
jgi:hypothetical protein